MLLPPLTLALCLAIQDDASEEDSYGRPPFELLRQDEDWSLFLGDGHWSDALKNVQTSEYTRVTIGGSARARFESWSGFDFGPPPPADDDDSFLLTHVIAHAAVRVSPAQRLFFEIRTAQATDRSLPGGRRAIDLDTLDVQQLFYDVGFGADDAFTLRLGRQQLAFGAQRLVSPLPWGNAERTWDGGSLTWRGDDWRATAFYTQFVPVMKTELNESDEQNALWGVYATRAPRAGGLGLDAYALGSERDPRTFNGTTGEDQRLTLGARLFGSLGGGFDLDAETAIQRGEVGDADVDAAMVGAQLGWRPEQGARACSRASTLVPATSRPAARSTPSTRCSRWDTRTSVRPTPSVART